MDRRVAGEEYPVAEDDVPGEWKQFTPVNAEFFNDGVSGIGSPGGAAQVGAVAADHPTVAGWEVV